MAGDHKQVLILGGGFGGLHLALALTGRWRETTT
jgi:NADH dehydrogenase FAD-containing subunit